MPYVQVSVPEQKLPAVYEVLLAGSDRTASPAATEAVAEEDADDPDDLEKRQTSVYREVTDGGRALLEANAEQTGKLTFSELESAAGVDNAGAGLQSISIQSKKAGLTEPLIDARRTRAGYVYPPMRPEWAALIRRLARGA